VVAAWTGTGEAQPLAGVEVRWTAPARCPGPDDVQARVRRLLGAHAPTASPKERLVADGTVVAADGRYRLTLTVRQGNEPSGVTRVFDSASCESLAGAAAVTLALLARGEARTDGAASRPSPGPPAPAQPPSEALPAASAPGTTSAGSPPATAPPATAPPATAPPAMAPPATAPPATAPPAMAPPAAAPSATAPADARASPRTAESLPGATPALPATPGFALEAPWLAVDAGVLPGFAYGVGAGVGVRVNQLRVRMAGVLWLPQRGHNAAPYEARYQRRTESCRPATLGPGDRSRWVLAWRWLSKT